ncbi:UNVERIFIED_CONTAM: hypothetical protein FKN15_014185 [Acipenser sinensis]
MVLAPGDSQKTPLNEPTIDYGFQRLQKVIPRHPGDPERLPKMCSFFTGSLSSLTGITSRTGIQCFESLPKLSCTKPCNLITLRNTIIYNAELTLPYPLSKRLCFGILYEKSFSKFVPSSPTMASSTSLPSNCSSSSGIFSFSPANMVSAVKQKSAFAPVVRPQTSPPPTCSSANGNSLQDQSFVDSSKYSTAGSLQGLAFS